MLSQGNGHDRAGVQALGVEMLLTPAVLAPATGTWTPGASTELKRGSRAQHLRFDSTKRFIDVVFSIALLAALAPLLAIVAVLVRTTSHGPALYRQRRLTVGGREFDMLKFRTMVNDAEKLSGPQFASQNDPRITRLGRFLRSTRIDELPQLLNVIRGDMSLIGPRPERPEMAETLAEELPNFSRRLAVKGGITGLAQVTAGYAANVQSYRHKLALDLVYIENRSLMLDLMIAVRTVRVVFTGTGSR